jgi:ABC-type amino acid transport system permease subunit
MNIFATVAHAATNPAVFFNPLGSTSDFFAFINKILDVLIQIGIPILVLFIVFAGFKFVTARGNESDVTKAKDALFWAVIGGAVLIGAKVIAEVIRATVGAI